MSEICNQDVASVTKSIDIATGKITYSKDVCGVKVNCPASCESEAADKLDRMIVDEIGVAGIVTKTIDVISVKYQQELDHLVETHSAQLLAVRQELLVANSRPWYKVLLARILWMQ